MVAAEVLAIPYLFAIPLQPKALESDSLSLEDRQIHTYLIESREIGYRLKRRLESKREDRREGRLRPVPNPESFSAIRHEYLKSSVRTFRREHNIPNNLQEVRNWNELEESRLAQMGFPLSWRGKQPKF